MRSIRFFFFLFIPLAAIMTVCKNVDNVSPTARTTFIKIYERGDNFEAEAVEALVDGSGYIVGYNLSDRRSLGFDAYVAKTDNFGNIVGAELKLPGSSIISIKVLASGGYLVYGDGIKTNSNASNIEDQIVTRAKIWKLSSDLDKAKIDSVSFYVPSDTTTDFHGTGITIDNNGNYVTSGTKKADNSFYKAFVAVYDPTTLDTIWTRLYDLVDQDFINAKNVYTSTNGQIVWSNSVQKATGTNILSYITIPSVEQASVYGNYSFLGQNNSSSNRLQVQEMQAGFFGYGMIGTISDVVGNSGNMFFVRAGFDGEFQENTIVVLDGIAGAKGVIGTGATAINAKPISTSQDAGLAICPTSDGGFLLAGTMTTTINGSANRGNGLLDVWIVRLDASNAVVWNKTYGGTGDDIVNSVRALNDGSFIVAGASSTGTSIANGGLVSAFIMRIDANGELQK